MKDDLLFKTLFAQATVRFSLDDKRVAAKFGVSRSTITRWRNGTTAPHSMMRRIIYAYLTNEAFQAVVSL